MSDDSYDDEFATDEWDDDDPDADLREDSDDTLTVTCTACGAEIYEDAVQCPRCGEYPSREDGTARSYVPFWARLLAALLVLSFVMSMLVGR